MSLDAETIVRKYTIRLASREAFGHCRVASVGDFGPAVLEALADAFIAPGPLMKVAGLRQKLKQVVLFVQRAPQAWEKIKAFLGIKGLKDIPGAFRSWAKKGMQALKKLVQQMMKSFPLNLYFIPKGKMPGLTDLLQRISEQVPFVGKMLDKVNTGVVQPLDKLMKRHLPNLSRPIYAAIFIAIWLNVAEISWDMDGLIKGFTGGISLGELFSSFPESSIGLVFAMLGVGYGFLPLTIVARLIWLSSKNYIEWKPGKGFVVNWERMGKAGVRPELVPA